MLWPDNGAASHHKEHKGHKKSIGGLAVIFVFFVVKHLRPSVVELN